MSERMVYGPIPINTKNGVYHVRGRLVWLELADGTPIHIGVDRREFAWCFTDIDSGGRISKQEVFDIAEAIRLTEAFLGTMTCDHYFTKQTEFQREYGYIDAR